MLLSLPLSVAGTTSATSPVCLLLRRSQPITGLDGAGWISPEATAAPELLSWLPDDTVMPWEDSAPDVPAPVPLELTERGAGGACAPGCSCVLLMTPAAVCALVPVGTVPMLLLPNRV